MKFFVYMLVSHQSKRLITYVGYTTNVLKRLKLHNSSKGAKFTRGRKWKIIFKKKYNTKSNAMKNEYLLKNDKKKRLKLKNIYKLKYNVK